MGHILAAFDDTDDDDNIDDDDDNIDDDDDNIDDDDNYDVDVACFAAAAASVLIIFTNQCRA